MTWTIVPLKGLGALQFDMSRRAVEGILGQPQKQKKSFTGSVREMRGVVFPILTYEEDRLVEIELRPEVPGVMFGTMDIFRSDPFQVLQELHLANNGALAGLGAVLFLNLGINTTGFVDLKTLRFRDTPDERSVTVSRKGQFDSLLENFSPWKIGA
jgi:hypothetical protein